MTSRIRTFWAELKRRRVFRVATAYGAVGTGVAVAVPDLFSAFGAPSWAAPLVIVLLILGFPIALVLAWALEMTPDGLQFTPPGETDTPGEGDATVATPTASSAPVDRTKAPAAAPATAAPSPLSLDGSAAQRPCVVVLPFANLSGDPENEAFSDGVTEDIMARLAGIRGLRVISRTSAMTYKGSRQSLPSIAAELGAQAVVEGTVRRSAGRVRVTAQLIAAETDEHLWADTYDRVLEDVFAVQSDVAENIARALDAELTPGERERLERKPTENLEAYELCLKGWGAAESLTPHGLETAERHYRKAIDLDPGYARAWAGLALTLGLRAYLGDQNPSEFFPPMRAAANEAIRLDPRLADAHLALAHVALWYEWDWAKADRKIAKALELNPDDPGALGARAYSLMLRERFQEAERAGLESLRLDPLSQLRRTDMAQVYAFSGKPEEALAILDGVIRENPESYVGWNWRSLSHLYAGDLDSALEDIEKAIPIVGRAPNSLAHKALIHTLRGEREEAEQILEELQARAGREYVDPYCFFLSTLFMDGLDAAFPFLQQMLDKRSILAIYLRAAPAFHEFRSDPRFLDALRTIWPQDFQP